MRPTLTIGYSCLDERVPDLVVPETTSDIEIIVAIQGSPRLEHSPGGARVLPVDGIGVAKSRNAVLDAARGTFLLFCDDDVIVDLPGVLAGVRHLQSTDHALALGRGLDPSGVLRKSYPRTVTRLSRLNSAKASTYEMLVNVDHVRHAGVRFDERFGAGTELHLADEYIFVADLLRAGMSGEAIPEVFGSHPVTSSGDRWTTNHDVHVRAVAINRVFGVWAPFARGAFAIKHRRNLGSARRFARFVVDRTRPPKLSSTESGRVDGGTAISR